MTQWPQSNSQGLTCFGTVDSYDRGNVAFVTQIATSGDAADYSPSVARSMAFAILHAMDQSKIHDAFQALAQIEMGEEDIRIDLPEQVGVPVTLCAAFGDHTLAPFEFDTE